MPVTKKLKLYAEKEFELSDSATDAVILSKCKEAIRDEKLTMVKFAELMTEDVESPEAPADPSDEDDASGLKGNLSDDQLDILADKIAKRTKGSGGASGGRSRRIAKMAFDDEKDPTVIRVKSAVERFSDTKTALCYKNGPKVGQPIHCEGIEVNTPSERRLAKWAAWFKYTALPSYMLSQHDRDIVANIIHTEKFVDPYTSEKKAARLLNESEREQCKTRRYEWDDQVHGGFAVEATKAPLINDGSGGTSGGYNMVPEFFDFDGIVLPVLQREISPYVDLVTVPRGGAARAYTMGNPTFGAGPAEGTAATPFDATAFVGNVNTPFFRAVSAFEYGMNFQEDAVPDFASRLQATLGNKAGEWLDEQIINGDGTTEPLGILNAAGVIDVAPSTAADGIATMADAINLFFGVPKAYKNQYGNDSQMFAGREATYAKFRGLQVGASDQRLVFGNSDLADYKLLMRRFACEENGAGATDVIFGVFGGYRLYARQGLRFRLSSGSREDMLKNSSMLVADMRYGGRPIRGSYFAVIDDL